MRLRHLSLLLPWLLCQCDTAAPTPPLPPAQEPPATPLAADEVLRVPMTREDHEYLSELLEPFAEADEPISFYDEDNDDELIGTLAPAHFQVLSACPYKIHTGKLTAKRHTYEFAIEEGYSISVSLSHKPEHGVLVGGINISSPTFHHFLQSLIRKHHAEKQADTKNTPLEP